MEPNSLDTTLVSVLRRNGVPEPLWRAGTPNSPVAMAAHALSCSELKLAAGGQRKRCISCDMLLGPKFVTNQQC